MNLNVSHALMTILILIKMAIAPNILLILGVNFMKFLQIKKFFLKTLLIVRHVKKVTTLITMISVMYWKKKFLIVNTTMLKLFVKNAKWDSICSTTVKLVWSILSSIPIANLLFIVLNVQCVDLDMFLKVISVYLVGKT